MDNIPNVDFINGDFSETKVQEKIKNYFNNSINVIISDMAVNTTGNKNLDSFRTGQISIEAMLLAQQYLTNNGIFLTKVFMGSIFKEIKERASKIFKNIVIQKTKSSGYFYKHIKGFQGYNSVYQNFILTSGLKFNKVEIEMNLEKENCNCFILSGLCLGKEEHQEIKTRIITIN